MVTDEALKKRITQMGWAAQAPVIIVGCADPTKAGDKDENLTTYSTWDYQEF